MFTRKQELFIDNYVANPTKSGREIAVMSGYAQKGASVATARLLKNVNVKAEIDRRLKVISEQLEITDVNIVKLLWEEARDAKRSADRINALTQLAKIKGLMKDSPTQSVAIFGDLVKQLQTYDRQKDAEVVAEPVGAMVT